MLKEVGLDPGVGREELKLIVDRGWKEYGVFRDAEIFGCALFVQRSAGAQYIQIKQSAFSVPQRDQRVRVRGGNAQRVRSGEIIFRLSHGSLPVRSAVLLCLEEQYSTIRRIDARAPRIYTEIGQLPSTYR